MAGSNRIAVGGAPEGFDAKLILDEAARAEGPVIHVARDDKRMAAMEEALRFFAPEMPVIRFPGWDCLPYDRVSPNADISATRMATLAGLVHGGPSRFILLTTLNAATQRVPARDVLREAAFSAQVDYQIDEDALKSFLVRMGFTRAPTVMEPGDYAVRGGIIDIYPPGRAALCGWICSATCWTACGGSIRRRSAPRKSWTGSSWHRSARSFWTRPRSRALGRTTGSNSARRAVTTRFTRR